jgi:hypothetical protein
MASFRPAAKWHDLLPAWIAGQQIQWERMQFARRAREVGKLKLKEIGAALDITPQAARLLVSNAWHIKNRTSPAEKYMRRVILWPRSRPRQLERFRRWVRG